MVWECYCNASPKPEFFLFSLFIFSFISQLIWVHLGWNFHGWFSIQKQVHWWTIDPFSLKFCTSQHSYPVPLKFVSSSILLCWTTMHVCYERGIPILISDFFLLFTKPHFQTFNALRSTSLQALQIISDFSSQMFSHPSLVIQVSV